MNRYKISNGDFIVVSGCYGGTWSDGARDEFIKNVKGWLSDRGLQECRVMLTPGEEFVIKTLTVNDIFEDQVLNKNNS